MKNVLIWIGICIVGILLIVSVFFDFDFGTSNNNDEEENEEVRDFTGTDDNNVEVSEETENNNDNSNDENNNDDISEEEKKKKSKDTAIKFTQEFHSIDEEKDPLQHIENAKEYMNKEFYDTMIESYPVDPDGTDKQTYDDVSAKEFGKSNNDRIWDIHVKGKLKNDEEKEKIDMYYVVDVTEETDGDSVEVTNVWVDPTIPRDDDGNIDIYEGKGNMGENEDIEEADDLDEQEETELLINLLNKEQDEF